MKMFNIYFVILLIFLTEIGECFHEVTRERLRILREEVREMFQHSYDGYLQYAYPLDELRPLTCDGIDTWGSYSLTLIDALDTLAVMGNHSEFRRVAELIVTSHADMDLNINVSVFETNIRVVGGLLSAHLLLDKAGAELPLGWPCNGPLLVLAADVANRLLPAFDTPTGMPYGTVNLRYGVPPGETPITCTAGVGTFVVEFGALSRLTGDPLYERVALRALYALWERQSKLGLFGNHINVLTGKWTALDAGIGAGVDSYYEYLVKGSLLLRRPELAAMWERGRAAADQHLRRDDWHMWASMARGQITSPVFQSLEAFWPGLLSLAGDDAAAAGSLHNYFQVWKQYGFTPEFYNIPHGEATDGREGYPLRPELVESLMYLYRSTRNPTLIEMGETLLRSIQHSARTKCGYATVKNVHTHALDNRMESFFLAETTKYLYLLFDPDNFLHNPGTEAEVVETPRGTCVLHAGGYVFNTEAHPIDPAALECCSGPRLSDVLREIVDLPPHNSLKAFRGKRPKRRVETKPNTAEPATCPRPTLLQILLAAARRRGNVRTVKADASRPDAAAEPEGRWWRHLEQMRDREEESRFDRLRCARPPFEDRLQVYFEVFTR